ncbi:hypothetical protein D3C80_2054050 [compost metagenome]
MRGIDHRHQRLAKQLGRHQALRQWHRPHQPHLDGLVKDRLGHIAAAHFLEVQVHRWKTLAKGMNGLGDF